MPLRGKFRIGNAERLAEIKGISGWCIENRRRQLSIKQESIAADAKVTSRWLREIEGGNPKTTLDDHLRCAATLDLSIGYLTIPMLYMENGMRVPRELLLTNLEAIEDRCIQAVTDQIFGSLRQMLRPDNDDRHGR